MKKTDSVLFIVLFSLVSSTLFFACSTGSSGSSNEKTSNAITILKNGNVSGESLLSDTVKATAGSTITLTAQLGTGRKVFLSAGGVVFLPETITVNNGTVTFAMPAMPVEILATFSNIAVAGESGISGTLAVGDQGTITIATETVNMQYANNAESIAFPAGQADSVERTLTEKFWIGETEVTNAVMAAVLQWAYDTGRFSAVAGEHNELSTTVAKHGGQILLALNDPDCRVRYNGAGTFSVDNGYLNHPVTNITWYGAVIFCNWLTVMRDGTEVNQVYDGIDTDWAHGETVCNSERSGYRLPSRNEGEYASRYRGNDTVNTVSGYSTPCFTTGDSASGATDVCAEADACRAVAVYAGQNPSPVETAPVKSLGPASANTLGLYDMSGNVSEWCFDAYLTWGRLVRGGSWAKSESYLANGGIEYFPANGQYSFQGFRICRTAD